jgi:formylglycine-generating enzyme required for sulfatase activity
MKLARIPAGKFKMGSTNYHESPVHEVTISRAFWMGVFHVTQAQYEAVMGGNPSCFKNAGSYAPVECVTWNEARAFCQILTGMEGGGMEYRLPTEAEWEYACRAGTEGETYGPLDAIAWHLGNSGKTTHPVGQKRPNAFGLYDMLGNVWQWCQDWSAFYSAGPVTDPQGPSTGSGGGIRIMRGGSWARSVVFDDRNLCRSAERGGNSQGEGANNIGFRVVAVARTP